MTRFDFKNLKTQGGLPKKCEITQIRAVAHAYQFLFGLKISKIVRFLSLAGLFFASFLQIFGYFFGKILGQIQSIINKGGCIWNQGGVFGLHEWDLSCIFAIYKTHFL